VREQWIAVTSLLYAGMRLLNLTYFTLNGESMGPTATGQSLALLPCEMALTLDLLTFCLKLILASVKALMSLAACM